MFAPGPRAVGFTIVWPEGVIFSSMMTYHVQFLLLVVAGWVNRQQQDVIDYLQEENRVLRAGLRGKRLRLSDDDRRRLAVKAQALGREALAQIASVATPATCHSSKRSFSRLTTRDTALFDRCSSPSSGFSALRIRLLFAPDKYVPKIASSTSRVRRAYRGRAFRPDYLVGRAFFALGWYLLAQPPLPARRRTAHNADH